jgi:hypothetical protein
MFTPLAKQVQSFLFLWNSQNMLMNSYFFEVGDQIEVRLFLKARKSQTLPFLTSQVVQEPPKHEVQSDQLQLIFLNIGPCQKKKRKQGHKLIQCSSSWLRF